MEELPLTGLPREIPELTRGGLREGGKGRRGKGDSG